MNQWTIEYYSTRVEEEILHLPAGILARYVRLADALQTFGPDLGMPRTRSLGDGLFELRVKGSEGIARVFYCTLIGLRIIVLHSFVKKSQKIPAHELLKARRRLSEVKSR